jgi:hypothetical protein
MTSSGLNGDHISNPSSLREIAEQAFHWWVGELRAMVPASLIAKAPNWRTCPVDIFMTDDGALKVCSKDCETQLSGVDDVALREHLATLAGAVRIDVPRHLCLMRKTVLPKRALREARVLLALETAERTPFSEDTIYSDWFVEGEEQPSGQLHIRHIILARDRIAAIREILGETGLRLARITVGHGEGRPQPVDLFAHAEPGFRGFIQTLSWPARLVWTAAMLLLLAWPYFLIDRSERQLAAFEAQRAQVMRRVQAGPAVNPAGLGAATEIMARPAMMDILNEVSARLPPTVALQSVEWLDDRLTMQLATGTAAQVRDAFNDSPLLAPSDVNDDQRLIMLTLKTRTSDRD